MTFINERTVSDWNSDVVGLASYIGQIEETQTSCWISKIRDIMLRIDPYPSAKLIAWLNHMDGLRQTHAILSALLVASSTRGTVAIGLFQVRRKFSIMGGGCKGSDIGALQTHDRNRHLRRLVAADFSLGGLGGISTSSTGYMLQCSFGSIHFFLVDTGSSAFWVNCIPCKQCPRKSDILKKLTLYDPRSSVSSKVVKCDDMFCTSPDRDVQPECNTSLLCPFIATYADGGSTIGAFVTDLVHYNQLSGNGLTQSTNTSLTFGCGLQQSGSLNTPELAVDGIIGFANSNNTMLSQLAAAGKTKKIFSHCLDSRNGGGIFAIGEVVEPKVKTTPLVQNSWILYLVNLKMIDVGGTTLQLPANIFETAEMKGTFIDSGTTLAYLPEIVYKELMLAVFAKHPDITLHDTDNLECFNFLDSVDDRFPKISLQFENDLALDVYPHDYLLEYEGKQYCFGFQDAAKQDDGFKDMFLLGDMVISNKLVVYDMEKIVIGWTEYNCGERGCEGCMTVERFL
uniref:Peptidase A1 domain-containing protein n=1 Tax=Oryza rufipogon TaxID=4529 RepID=A0A0E0P7C8_ORYRU